MSSWKLTRSKYFDFTNLYMSAFQGDKLWNKLMSNKNQNKNLQFENSCLFFVVLERERRFDPSFFMGREYIY